MTISDKGAKFICGFEGFQSKAYQDSGGIWTIGFGSTHYKNGATVAPNDKPLARQEGIALLQDHIGKEVAPGLYRLLGDMKQYEFDALCSFIYNVGMGNFLKSGLLQGIRNKSHAEDIKAEFYKWNKAGDKVVEGLVRRRAAEAALYLTGNY